MRDDQTNLEEEKLADGANYSIILHPHRSLSPRGFLVLMVFIGIVSFSAGLGFLLMGAWPVFGFFGLDVLLIYLAFKMNYKVGRQSEIIKISGDQLKVRIVSSAGDETEYNFQAYWSRLEVIGDTLLVKCRGEEMEIGHFLIDEEKEEVRHALTSALYKYRHGGAF